MNRIVLLTAALLLAVTTLPAAALDLSEIFKTKPPLNEEERKETIERIKDVQEKLRLLQDKLRVLEKRKAQEAAFRTASGTALEPVAGEINWQAVDQTTTDPGEFGLYTYLLYNGSDSDSAALGGLEDLILTIETLPASQEPPAIGNRFLLPVEPSQSTVALARRPYDFKLSRTYLDRLGLTDFGPGPVLVSLDQPLDPYGSGEVPAFLAVFIGEQSPQSHLALAKTWHGYEKSPLAADGHPLAELFWKLLDGRGPTRVSREGGRLLLDLSAAGSRPQAE
jgi:hypothetical protein